MKVPIAIGNVMIIAKTTENVPFFNNNLAVTVLAEFFKAMICILYNV